MASLVVPERPTSDVIDMVHRGHDGYLSFTRKRGTEGNDWDELCSVKASELDTWFPELRADLMRDSYYTVCGFYRPGFGRSVVDPRLPRARRLTKEVRWLTACFADLDTRHLPGGLTDGQAIGVLLDEQDRGHVPPASIIARSGRGLWAFWVL
jgi:hypothetical protein